jgi:tetratricopeptide (TPR) repeat protein
VETLDFSPDSCRLLSTSADGTAKIITLPPVSDTLPPWLADLAEAVAGKRIGASGGVEQAGREELDAIQHRIAHMSQKSGYVSWARWFFAEPQQRQASPAVRLMTRDYLAVRARGETLQEQYEAFKIDPNNGLISCRIGYLLAASKRRQHLQPHARSHWDAVALWYAEQGTDLSPDAGEAWALRATIQQIVGAPSDEAVARAVTLEAQNPIVGYVKAFQLHAQGQLVEAYQAFTGSVDSLPENRYTLDWNNDKPFLIGALRTILDEDERNPVTLAQAGQKRLVEAFDTVERRRVEAEWLTRMATQLCPDDTEIWRLRGQVLALLERHDEALLSLQKSAELDAQGEPVWPQVGQFVREHSEHLIDVKQDARADSYLLKYGVPPRSDLLTADQVDLTKYYNHTLVEEPYRAAESKSKGGSIWHRLPLGSAELNGVLFDVRGMIRLSGGAFSSVDFSRPLPSAVRGIEVNRQADWLHFLHNVEAASQVPDGEEVGYYQICYADGETRRLPIRYGHDVVMWRENEFALPLGGALAWSEGRYEECKTLYHSTWENPRPAVPIAAIDFVSNNSSAAPFLLAMSLELARQQTVDPEVSSRRALHRAVYVQGQTDLTRRSVESEALHAQEADPLNIELMYRRSEVLLAIGKIEESFALVSQLRRNSPHHPSYRLLQGRIEWQQGQRLAAAETLRLPAGNVAVRQLLTQIDRVQLERFHRSVLEALGPHQARDFFVTTQVVPRDPDLPSEVVDLTSYYNAALAESWYTPTEAVGPCASLFRTLQPGPQVIQGIRFDMRGIIQLNDRKELVMKTNFPRQLTGIAVGVAGDQIHFLHAGFDNDLPNTPGATYLIHMEDGTAHEFLARWERDIGLPYMSRNGSSRATVAWRSAGVTSSSEESDAVLYVATWTNPTPNEKIRSVDFLVAGGKTQPCLVAMTVEAFDQELTRGPGEALRLSILALQKAQSRQLRLPKVAEYTANLITKAVIDAPNDATVRRYEAEVALCLGNLEDAQVAIELAIELDKASSLNWEIYGRVLARQKRFAEVQLARLKTRALQLRELIPDRDESMDKRLIDLSHHYNVALCENPFETVRQDRTRSEHLGNLPHGVAKFGGIEFDVRGVVALHGKQSQLRPLRAKLHEQVEKIAVGQTASRLHVLHGVGWGSTLPHGTVVANVVVHYRNEMTIEIPIRIGADVRDWFLSNNHRRQVTEGELVWVQPSSEVGSRDIGLYLLTWENPHPEEVIQSLDYESTLTDASAFLLGVTCTN